MRAPPISSSVTFSPMTISAMRGEPRYMLALLSTITTTSQNAGMYAPPPPTGRTAGRSAGSRPAQLDLVVEDAARAAPPGEHLDLVGDARARRVDQVEQRAARGARAVSCTRRIFSTVRRPHEPAFTVGVVRHHAHRAAVDRPGAGDDAVGRQLGIQRVGERGVLDEAAVIDEQRDALAARTACPARRSSRGTSARRPSRCAP